MSYSVLKVGTEPREPMNKRNPHGITQRMVGRPVRPDDTTDPLGASDLNQPDVPPASQKTPATGPAPSREEVHEANSLLEAFKQKPLVPPAPRPKEQPSSDGGAFVAYSTVARPAPRSVQDDEQGALVEIARLASVPDESRSGDGAMLAAQRDIATYVAKPARKGPTASQTALGIAVLLVLGGAVALFVTLASPAAQGPAPASSKAESPVIPSASAPALPPPRPAPPTSADVPRPLPPAEAPAASGAHVAPAPTATPISSGTPGGMVRPRTPKPTQPATDRFSW